jgi:hypothetical protein
MKVTAAESRTDVTATMAIGNARELNPSMARVPTRTLFDARSPETPSAEYVVWVDVMGTQARDVAFSLQEQSNAAS